MSSPWKTGKLAVLWVAAAPLILLYAACADRQPTAVPEEEPSRVIRGYESGCVPEVDTLSTDSTEVFLFHFTGDTSDGRCYPNLVEWGVDMADPMGVDTPQGTASWQVRTDLDVANMPSLSYPATLTSQTPPQVTIEFDPPVRSVEFYYSRWSPSRALWGGDMVNVDSMWVGAMERFPGTTSYNTCDSEILYSNNPSGSLTYGQWDSVSFNAGV